MGTSISRIDQDNILMYKTYINPNKVPGPLGAIREALEALVSLIGDIPSNVVVTTHSTPGGAYEIMIWRDKS